MLASGVNQIGGAKCIADCRQGAQDRANAARLLREQAAQAAAQQATAQQEALNNCQQLTRSWAVGEVTFQQTGLWDDNAWCYGKSYSATNPSTKPQQVSIWLTSGQNIQNLLSAGTITLRPGYQVPLGFIRRADANGKWSSEAMSSATPIVAPQSKIVNGPHVGNGNMTGGIYAGYDDRPNEKNIRAMKNIPLPDRGAPPTKSSCSSLWACPYTRAGDFSHSGTYEAYTKAGDVIVDALADGLGVGKSGQLIMHGVAEDLPEAGIKAADAQTKYEQWRIREMDRIRGKQKECMAKVPPDVACANHWGQYANEIRDNGTSALGIVGWGAIRDWKEIGGDYIVDKGEDVIIDAVTATGNKGPKTMRDVLLPSSEPIREIFLPSPDRLAKGKILIGLIGKVKKNVADEAIKEGFNSSLDGVAKGYQETRPQD
jgi:hypothetical protein